jgi:superfamily II DNA or RNA helicase
MLDLLDVERRVHDRHRTLVLAATGTGKTVIAALDYRRLADEAGDRPLLLFVAHRREILEESLGRTARCSTMPTLVSSTSAAPARNAAPRLCKRLVVDRLRSDPQSLPTPTTWR